ncbi:MAG: LPS export ABC transporter periplasmic protein LptC [Ferruginibacter sp.]
MEVMLHRSSRIFRDITRLHIPRRNTFILQILFFLFLTVLLYSCGNSDKDVTAYTTKSLGIEEIKNADINYTLGGKAKAKLRSPLMLRVQDVTPYVEFPKTLHVDFFNETGAVDSRLDALYGKYFDLESKVFLKDSVKVINILGDTLYCNELWWDRSRKGNEFYTDKPVRIRRKLQVIDGIGMDASQDFKAWHIINPVGTINVPSSQFPSN